MTDRDRASRSERAWINYQVRQAAPLQILVDPEGETGKRIEPEHDRVEVTLHDVRTDRAPTFDQQGVAFVEAQELTMDVTQQAVREQHYSKAVADFLSQSLGASEVVVFDHTLRGVDGHRRPAQHVHTDYARDAGRQRLFDVLEASRAADWADGHFGIVNLWRPVAYPAELDPLVFVDTATVAAQDWVNIDIIYPDRQGQIQGLTHSPDHHWWYQSRMSPEEAVIFNAFDSGKRVPVPHTSATLSRPSPNARPRQSIESRALVRYPD